MKEHPIHKGYFVTEDGRVFSYWKRHDHTWLIDYNRKPKELSQYVCSTRDRDTYKSIKVKGKNLKVHRLVAEIYLPNPDNLPVINHKNGIKDDNRLENLEWCDVQYNNEYSRAKYYIVENIHTKEQFEVFNLSKWCRENNLGDGALHGTKGTSPKTSQHKGFRIIYQST